MSEIEMKHRNFTLVVAAAAGIGFAGAGIAGSGYGHSARSGMDAQSPAPSGMRGQGTSDAGTTAQSSIFGSDAVSERSSPATVPPPPASTVSLADPHSPSGPNLTLQVSGPTLLFSDGQWYSYSGGEWYAFDGSAWYSLSDSAQWLSSGGYVYDEY